MALGVLLLVLGFFCTPMRICSQGTLRMVERAGKQVRERMSQEERERVFEYSGDDIGREDAMLITYARVSDRFAGRAIAATGVFGFTLLTWGVVEGAVRTRRERKGRLMQNSGVATREAE